MAAAVPDEEHVWYTLAVDRAQAFSLAEGYELRLAGRAADAAFLDRLPVISAHDAGRRLADGAELWVVEREGDLAFSAWIFPERTPVWAARGGVLELPAGVACLEDSATSSAHRRRGLAAAVWSAMAAAVADRGFLAMVTKVGVENVPSRRAVEKAGFRAAAFMHHRRRGVRSRVSIELAPGELTEVERAAARALQHSLTR